MKSQTAEPTSDQVQIRMLASIEEMREIVQLQRRIWGYGETGSDFPYPARALYALSESGGLIAGAFHQNVMVGFSVAWLGREKPGGQLYLHSQLLGVLPDFRSLNLGYQLKLFQRDFALNQQLRLIRWTFDPLQSVNANLNLRKLGTVASHYRAHFYGDIESFLSHGTETDRLWADWYIDSPRVSSRLDQRRSPDPATDVPQVNHCRTDGPAKIKRMVAYSLDLQHPDILVEIPPDFDHIRQKDPVVAAEWRGGVREILQSYLSRGYIVDDFCLQKEETGVRAFFHLTATSLSDILKTL